MTVDGDIKIVEDFLNLEGMELVKNVIKMQGTETLKHHGSNFLPKLNAPLDHENEDKFWKDLLVREQVKAYFLVLKWKKGKQLWWPSCLCYEKFIHVSHNTIRQNKLILKAILEYYNFDPVTHCEFPPLPEKNKRTRCHTTKETMVEEEGMIDEQLDLNNSKNIGKKRKGTKKN